MQWLPQRRTRVQWKLDIEKAAVESQRTSPSGDAGRAIKWHGDGSVCVCLNLFAIQQNIRTMEWGAVLEYPIARRSVVKWTMVNEVRINGTVLHARDRSN
jgi:hypothetical protein